jgi:hypothetical protein
MSFFEPVELTVDPIAAYQFTQQSPLPQTNRQAQVNGYTDAVILLILFVMSCVVSIHGYKRHRNYQKYRQQQELNRSQQIEMLKRMWTISPNR